MSLFLSENQFIHYIHEMFPKLEGRVPTFYKLDKNRRPSSINIKSPNCIKELEYSGIIIVATGSLSESCKLLFET